MACDINNIVAQLNNLIDTSIKGKAESIKQDEKGNFHITWGDEYRVKNRAQAVRMAEQKVNTANKVVEKEGFHGRFGPYLGIDTSLNDEIIINKLHPARLIRALELRNEAEDQDKVIEEIMTEQDKEFFAQQAQDQQVLSEQNDNKPVEEAPEGISDKIKNTDWYKNMNKKDPYRAMIDLDVNETLKFFAEQYYRGVRIDPNSTNAGEGTGLTAIPDEVMDIARQLFPRESFITPNDLPPINPEC